MKNAYEADTTYQAVYKRVKNVIDASQQDEIPDGYVATIFLPGFGRTWADGSYKPKLLYIRHGKDREDNIKFAKKVASDTAATLSGFTKWQMYDAKSRKSNILLHDNWDISKPRIFVAEQNGVDDVKIPETVIGVGESIPNVNKLIHNTDPRVSVSVDENAKVDVSKPGISTIMVNVTKPTDEKDKNTEKQKTVTTKLPVRVYVLPKVIADNDLPAEGTAAAKFIEKNYTKVTYAAGSGGEMKSPVFTYWVRRGAKDLQMPVPDVLADKGYVFKDWTSITTEKPAATADKRKATEEEREALARMAIMDGMPYVAKLIRNSDKSTLAALQNLLNEAQKQHAAQVYNAKREELAKIAEMDGKSYVAKLIRDSHNSSIEALKNLMREAKIDVDSIVEKNLQRDNLAKIAKEAGKEKLAEEISKSNDSLTDLRTKLEKAGIDLTFANFENEIDSYVLDEQREVLAELADEADKPSVAKIIRSSKKSSLEALKQLLRKAGVNPEISLPEPQPTRETTITANFEQMDPVEFKFSGKAIEGVPATFTLANLTRGVLKADGTTDTNATVSVDGKPFTVNALSSNSLNQLGISHYCTGTSCTISGTPKIVDGKKVVELTFTSVDKYGREARVTVDIEVIPENKPTPVPSPSPTPQPQPAPQPPVVVPSAPSAPVLPFDVCECNDSESCAVPKPETKEPAKPAHSLAKTGSNVAQSAILASLLASVGLAGLAAKHRRKREDGKNN